jgi:hypothetical protein
LTICFEICAVFGLTILACQTTLSVLGFGRTYRLSDEDTDSDSDWVDSSDQWDNDKIQIPPEADPIRLIADSNARLTMNRLRSVGLAIAFFGLMGYAAHASQFSLLQTYALAVLTAGSAYLGSALLSSK